MADALYQPMRELRNNVLLRPLGVPDNSWEMYDHRSWHFVAAKDHEVIGCAVLVPSEEDPTTARLIQMAVDGNTQGKGVGKALLEQIIVFARGRKLKSITCHSRHYAVGFYEKLGFEVYGEELEEVGMPHRHMRISLQPTG